MQSPHSFFENVRRTGRSAVLLEGGGTEEKENGARRGWSFVGIVDESIRVPPGEEGLFFMRDFIKKYGRPRPKCAPPFTRGFAGFISYDLGEEWMGISNRSNVRKGMRRFNAVPSAHFVFVNKVHSFPPTRHLQVSDPEVFAARAPFEKAKRANVAYARISRTPSECRAEYFKKICRVKEYLLSGDTYQVNFSQRFEMPYGGDACGLYKKLAAINPSPFQFFMETKDFAVISNSPERLFRISEGRPFCFCRVLPRSVRIIETRPIKGTVPRGKTAREERENVQRLLVSPKERAELAMIVDLERNDLGKLCVPGTVEVNEDRVIEKYSHVIHTVSNVRGILEQQFDWYDALHALFPGGSVTGCPKKRTMEIIRELEDEPRGIYCGSAGYIDLSGACDFNIMIRTLWLEKGQNAGGRSRLIFRSGGGIVADSETEKEYEETLYKMEAFSRALE